MTNENNSANLIINIPNIIIPAINVNDKKINKCGRPNVTGIITM